MLQGQDNGIKMQEAPFDVVDCCPKCAYMFTRTAVIRVYGDAAAVKIGLIIAHAKKNCANFFCIIITSSSAIQTI